MKSSGRTEKSVGNRSSMCEREGLKIGGCTATGLLKMQNNKRRECADSVYTVMGADTSVAAREHTPMFLFVAQNCCITSRKKKKKRTTAAPRSATWVISYRHCQIGLSDEQQVCGFHRNISVPMTHTAALFLILTNGLAYRKPY